MRLWGVPGGTFMGVVVASAVVRLSWAKARRPPRPLQSFARVILGLTIGIPVTRQALQAASGAIIPVILMIVGLIALCFFFAWLASRFSGLDFTTALCGTSPGGATVMVVLSDDLGAQSPIVTTLHLFRILLIVILMPLCMGVFWPEGAAYPGHSFAAASQETPFVYYAKLASLVVCSVPMAWLAKRAKIPTAEVLTGIFVAVIANPLFLHLDANPFGWQLFAVWILATNMGTQLTREALRVILNYLPVCGILTILLLAAGALLGWFLYATTSLDLVTALLGSCPGGLDTMILLAGDMHANVPLVAAMHTARQILIMLTMPFLIRRIVRKKAESSP